MNQKTLTIAGAVLIIVVGVASFKLFYKPTTSVTIKNDTSNAVAVTGCGATPETAQPAEQIDVRGLARGAAVYCVVKDASGSNLGCLYLPTSASITEVSISAVRKPMAFKGTTGCETP